ncbi:hypothetical protein BGZ95_005580, partial [Linnemannia exigua]
MNTWFWYDRNGVEPKTISPEGVENRSKQPDGAWLYHGCNNVEPKAASVEPEAIPLLALPSPPH